MNPKVKELYDAAVKARSNSYSPYSGHQVGAAVRLSDGSVFSGCNIENSSYGGTNCAERVAIQKAVSEKGKVRIAEILVVTDASPPWPPCGLCRQVISEFGQKVDIYMCNLKGEVKQTTLTELFPQAFTPSHLHT